MIDVKNLPPEQQALIQEIQAEAFRAMEESMKNEQAM